MDSDRWLVPYRSELDLNEVDPDATPDAPGDKDVTKKESEVLKDRLIELQERLWAENKRSLLLVLQAMDAGGKDGAIKKVFSGVNPQGCRVVSFKAPSPEELEHDFLWRIYKELPEQGEIGIFNRSHYEDAVVVRVRELVPKKVWEKRYPIINAFEYALTQAGTQVVKVFLHISKDEQAKRLQKRLDNPDKLWKFNQADLAERARWDVYMTAYRDAIVKTSRDDAPWYVIPADHKWYRDWALLTILVEHLEKMDPQWPEPEEGLDDVVID